LTRPDLASEGHTYVSYANIRMTSTRH
jgi:hypothetical protein